MKPLAPPIPIVVGAGREELALGFWPACRPPAVEAVSLFPHLQTVKRAVWRQRTQNVRGKADHDVSDYFCLSIVTTAFRKVRQLDCVPIRPAIWRDSRRTFFHRSGERSG